MIKLTVIHGEQTDDAVFNALDLRKALFDGGYVEELSEPYDPDVGDCARHMEWSEGYAIYFALDLETWDGRS